MSSGARHCYFLADRWGITILNFIGGYVMKKVRTLSALLLAAALTLGSFSIVFADDTTPAADATVTQATQYDALDVTATSFYNLRYADLGSYPVVNGGYADLNTQILNDLEQAFSIATDKSFTDSDNVFSVSYTVTDSGQFAKIDVTYNYQLTAASILPYSVTNTYYVDKALGQAITADDYNKAVTPETAPAADNSAETPGTGSTATTAPAVDNANAITMVPVRQYAEKLGYTLSWDGSTQSVILTKGDARFTITVGVNEYLVDNQMVPLESAPENQDGSVYVPVTFFTKVLGASYSVDMDGNIVIQ